MPLAKSPSQKLSEQAFAFVKNQDGNWNHEQWEQAVSNAASLGFDMNDEAKRNLGNILEALKYFHLALPKGAAEPKPAIQKQASAKQPSAKKKASKK